LQAAPWDPQGEGRAIDQVAGASGGVAADSRRSIERIASAASSVSRGCQALGDLVGHAHGMIAGPSDANPILGRWTNP
jgi:hypothetical protein